MQKPVLDSSLDLMLPRHSVLTILPHVSRAASSAEQIGESFDLRDPESGRGHVGMMMETVHGRR